MCSLPISFEITDGRTVAPLDPTFQLLGGGIDGSIGATASWALGLVAVAAVVFFAVKARSKRLRYGFPVKPLWAEIAMIAAWALLILSFVMVMNAYTKPRSDITRGIPIPVLILLRSEEHTSELQSLMRISYAVFCLKHT